MSACESYSELISAHLDGALAADERARLTEHLASCEACRTYMAELAAIRAALSDAEDVDVPDGFAESVMQRVRESAPQRKKPSVLRRLAPLAACAAVFAVVFAANGFSGFGGASAGDAAAPMESMTVTTADSYSTAAEESEADIMLDDAYADAEADYDLPTARDVEEVAQTEMLTDMTAAKGAMSAPVQLRAPYSDVFAAWLSENGARCAVKEDAFVCTVDAETMADFAAFLDESGTAYVQEASSDGENVIVLEK